MHMRLSQATALVALLAPAAVLAAPVPDADVAAAGSGKYCDAATTICYTEYSTAQGIAFRFAIPDTAKAGTPYDVLISIVAPKAVGWAGIAWGGVMANNPLTVAWPNGANTVVSSRRAP
jgi:hypothetical protein